MRTRPKPGESMADKVFDYLEKHGKATNPVIAKALDVDPNALAARTTQMFQGGSLDRVTVVGPNKGRHGEPRAAFEYSIKDRNARTSAPFKKKAPEIPKELIESVARATAPLPPPLDIDPRVDPDIKALRDADEPRASDPPDYRRRGVAQMVEVRLAAKRMGFDWATRQELGDEARREVELGEHDEAESADAATVRIWHKLGGKPGWLERRAEAKREAERLAAAEAKIHADRPAPSELRQEAEVNGMPTLDEVLNDNRALVAQPERPNALTALAQMMGQMADLMADQIVAQVAASLAQRVAGMAVGLREHMQTTGATVEEVAQHLAEEIAKPKDEPKDRLRTITVVGLRPAQQHTIREEFKNCFKLNFWYDDNLEQLKAWAKNSERCIALMAATPHNVPNTLAAVGCPIDRVTGNVHHVREKLTKLFVTPPPTH